MLIMNMISASPFLQSAGDAPTPSAVSHTNMPQSPATQVPELIAIVGSRLDLQNQTCDLGVTTPSEDEFVPGAFCK